MLVGRSHELECIRALVAAARDGRAGALVVRGEPGIGKTALLDQSVAGATGFRVLRAVGVESEAELACAGLHALLRPVLACLEALPPPQAAAMRAALALGGLGLAALARGELETARRELEETIRLRPALHVDWPGLPSRTDLAEVLIRLGEPAQALSLVASFEQAQAGRPASLATARRCRLLAAEDDALDGVARDAITAIEGRSPFEEARTRLVYGERLRRAGRRVDARRELELSRELFEGLGAEAWAERARHEIGRAPRGSARRGPSSTS